MLVTTDFPVTKVKHSKLQDLDLNSLPFGKYFTDHMLEADYENGEWKNVEIKPFQPLSLSPALSAIHYGQAIFEGMKAYKNEKGEAFIFRPINNYQRFNTSAARMQMPAITEEIFIEGLKQLVALDSNWIPDQPDHSLYIRPFMFATDEALGVRPSDTYKFMIILSPTGPYHSAPMRLYVEEYYTRAVPGGVGFAKAAGNYAVSLHPAAKAKELGYDQILWTDAFEHKYIQEAGMMNVMFIIDNKVITPDLASGTILAGVTRDSVLTLLQEMGFTVEERPISIDEVIAAYKDGSLKEVFGTGTAATISMVQELRYEDFVMKFDIAKWQTAPAVKQLLHEIKTGKKEDKYGWLVKV